MIDAARIQHRAQAVVCPVLKSMGAPYASPHAAALILATGYTESRLIARDQGDPNVPGPAYSWYQIEMKTFVGLAKDWPDFFKFLDSWGLRSVWDNNPGMLLTASEAFATIAARGNYFADYWARRRPIPAMDRHDPDVAADYYLKAWRPADPVKTRPRFLACWQACVDATLVHW